MSTWTPPPRTQPIRLQTFPWSHPTMLAPLEGVSHPLFRELIAQKGGVGIVCTEFVRIGTNAIAEKHMAKHVVKASTGVPLSVQVMGTHVETMADAAMMVAKAGADVVDINLGCPSPRVVSKGAGSAMLKNPQLCYDVLCAMRERVPGLQSAKIRAGFDEAGHVVDIAKAIEAAGVDFLIVHPRRRADFYNGVADWRIIKTLKEELQIPVVGNGDCWYASDVQRMRDETGCDAVMMGRPALRNPWIFLQSAQIAAGETPFSPTGKDVVEWMQLVHDEFCAEFDFLPRGPIGKIKELLTYIGRAVRDGGTFRSAVLRLQKLDEIMVFIDKELGSLTATDLDLDASPTQPLERSGSAVRERIEEDGSQLEAPVDEAGEASGWI